MYWKLGAEAHIIIISFKKKKFLVSKNYKYVRIRQNKIAQLIDFQIADPQTISNLPDLQRVVHVFHL